MGERPVALAPVGTLRSHRQGAVVAAQKRTNVETMLKVRRAERRASR